MKKPLTTIELKQLRADPVVRGCLDRLRRGDVNGVGVLADYLEENSLPLAKPVRRGWTKYVKAVALWQTADMSRRHEARWEKIARWRRALRRRVCLMFKYDWRVLPLETYR